MATSLQGAAFDNLRGTVTNVRTAGIWAGNRKRKLNDEKVKDLIESIRSVGLFQAIGVRHMTAEERVNNNDDKGLVLIFGAHRLEAHMRLFSDAKDDTIELGRWEFIPAVVYPETISDDWAEVAEITENLLRYELNDTEKAVYTVELTGLYKELGLVQDAVKKRAVSQTNPGLRHDVAVDVPETQLPTATEKVTKDLGISDRQLQRHVAEVSRRSGTKISAEKTSGPDLREAAAEARKNAPPTKDQINERFVTWMQAVITPTEMPEFKRLLKDITKSKVLEML